MSSEDEYVYKLGLDYKDFASAANSILSILGNIEDRLEGSTPRAARKASEALTDLMRGVRAAGGKVEINLDDKKAIATERRQIRELDALVSELRVAEREYQRFLEGQATGLGGGKSFIEYSTAQLEQFASTARAVGARGALVGDSNKANTEDAAKATADARALADIEKNAATEEERAAAANARFRQQAAAEAARTATAQERDAEQRLKLEHQIAQQVESYQAQTLAAEKRVTAEVEAQAQARQRAGQAATSQIEASDKAAAEAVTQQNQRRLAGSTVTNLAGVGASNTRNTASTNLGSAASDEGYSQQTLAQMRAFYGAQEEAQNKAERLNQALKDQYERELPRLRYALYDVSTATALVGGGLAAASLGIVKTAADYQSAYASVKRTSDLFTTGSLTSTQKASAFSGLREDLKGLDTELPVTFEQLSSIATAGNQLGISANDITSFTKTVAEFSATTNVSTDEAATAFGRLGALLKNTNYRQIGDEIAYLGVKAVATESDIIDTSSQLAVSLQSLNKGTPESIEETTQATLALATSVTSLGVKPEQARGTFIRAFSAIGAAVDQGGASLDTIARKSKMSSADFKAQWQAGGTSAYKAFLQFTQGLGTSSGQINESLSSIGITAVRDRQTLGLLAQNGGRALKDLANAATGSSNDFLAKAYGAQAETVTAKLTELGNGVLNLFDTIGGATTGPLSHALDFLKGFVGFIDDIAASPGQATMLAIAVALAAITAAGLLTVSVTGRFAANLIALQQLLATNIRGSSGLTAVWNAATGAGQRLATATTEVAVANEGLSVSQAAANRGAAASGGGLLLFGQNAGKAEAGASKLASASSKLGGIIGKAGLAGAILSTVFLLPSLAEGIKGIVDDMKGATPEVDDLTAAVHGLGQAGADMAQKTITNGFQAFGTKAKDASESYQLSGSFGNGYSTLQQTPNGDGSKTISAGAAAVNNALTGQNLLKGQTLDSNSDVGTAVKELQNADKAIAGLFQSGDSKAAHTLLDQLEASMKKAGVSAPRLESALTQTKIALGAQAGQSLKSAEATQKDAASMDDGTTAAQSFSDALAGIFDSQIASQKVTDDLEDLGTAAVTAGAQVAFNGDKMQSTIQDIFTAADGDGGAAKAQLQSLYDQLLKLGYAKSSLLSLSEAIAGIPDAATEGSVNLASFSKGVADARTQADGTAASVRTLTDYASDLGGVLSRAFDLRFGDQEGLDKLTSGFQDAKDAIKDARTELAKAKADLASLKSDQATRQYQLGIATQFGDTARAASLQADIAKGALDIKDKQKDVSDAKEKTDRSLTGNGKAAIDNRATMYGQIQNGQAYLQSLAANGASQKELTDAAAKLKAQFIEQGVQMGYSKKDLTTLAAAYDDYSKVIKAVPKKITTKVSSNAGAAATALAEYNAKLDKIDGKTVTTQIVQQAINVADPADLSSDAAVARSRQKAASSALAKKAGQFREGGYTGSAPHWQSAGEVHGDEFVLNSQGHRLFPRQMLEAANHGVAPVIPRITTTATIGSGATMSLGRVERQLLAAASGGSGALSVQGARLGSAMDQAFAQQNRRGSN